MMEIARLPGDLHGISDIVSTLGPGYPHAYAVLRRHSLPRLHLILGRQRSMHQEVFAALGSILDLCLAFPCSRLSFSPLVTVWNAIDGLTSFLDRNLFLFVFKSYA